MRMKLSFSMTIFLSFLLFSCARVSLREAKPENWAFESSMLVNAPVVGRSEGGQEFRLAGFSGLHYLGKGPKGGRLFATHTDRGPNSEPLSIARIGVGKRPFLLPNFQPRIVIVEANGKKLEIVREILLKDFSGQPISGLPNLPKSEGFGDEDPIGPKGAAVPRDLIGVDLEGITQDASGHWWMCEEYRPSILEFSAEGILLRRFVPAGTYSKAQINEIERRWGANKVWETLPTELRQRMVNRGFEGITFHSGKIVASMQSPLLPDGDFIRLVQMNPSSGKVEAQFSYPLTRQDTDKIGDIASTPDGLLVLEQNSSTGKEGVHNIVLVEPLKTNEGLVPLKKQLVLNLVAAGYSNYAKVEGMAYLPGGLIAVVNDDDFGLKGYVDITNGRIPMGGDQPTELAILSPRPKEASKD